MARLLTRRDVQRRRYRSRLSCSSNGQRFGSTAKRRVMPVFVFFSRLSPECASVATCTWTTMRLGVIRPKRLRSPYVEAHRGVAFA